MCSKCATSVRNRPTSSSTFSPGLQTAVDLEEQALADAQRGVAALQLEHLGVRAFALVAAQRGERTRRHKREAAVPRSDPRARRDGVEHRAAEVLVGGRLREHADDSLLAHARDHRGLEPVEPRLLGLEREDQRDEIARGAARRDHIEQSEHPAADRCPPFDAIGERRALDAAALAGEPALRRDVARQDIVRSNWPRNLVAAAPRHAAAPVGQKLLSPSMSTSTGGLVAQHVFVPGGRRSVAAQPEPVEAVARQRQQVRQLADRRERRAAEQLDRHGALVLRRSSSTGCAERDRFATHRIMSSPYSRRYDEASCDCRDG